MNPILLQKQMRDNANDLQQFCKELKSWGEEMKRKEDELKGVSPKQSETKVEEKKKIKKVRISEPAVTKKKYCTDYSAWEKFDVDAECGKIDDEDYEESDLTDEHDEAKRDEALLFKEKGNKFVKSQKWEDAIKCYTKAIDCYRYDPIYYANRALCYLKLKQFKKAEEDCTLSLKLDSTYVKAYQRRAAAREEMGELDGAKYDLQQVLKYEPNNKESKTVLEKLIKKIEDKKASEPQRPVSKFTATRAQKKSTNTIFGTQAAINKINAPPVQSEPSQINVQKKVDSSKNISLWPSGDNVELVRPTKKPPHLQSKKPLKRIEIKDIDSTVKEQVKMSNGKIENEPVAVKNHVVERQMPIESVPENEPVAVKNHVVERQMPVESVPENEPVAVKNHVVERQMPVESVPSTPKEFGDMYSLKIDELKVTEKISNDKNTKESVISEKFTEKMNILDNKTNVTNLIENNTEKEKKKISSKTENSLNFDINKEMKNFDNGVRKLNSMAQAYNDILNRPKTSVQFYSCWKQLRDSNLKYEYLSRFVQPEMLPDIFKESLDSDTFSEFLKIMVNYFIQKKDPVYKFLYYLTQVKRFSALAMFMSTNDKNNIWKLIDYIKGNENVLKEDVDKLIEKYEL